MLHPTASRPKMMTRAEFEEVWDGRLILTGSQNLAERVLHALAGMSVSVRELARRSASRALDPLMRARDVFMGARDVLIRARDTLMHAARTDRSDDVAALTSAQFQSASAESESGDEIGPHRSDDLASLPWHCGRPRPDSASDGYGEGRRRRNPALRKGVRAQGTDAEDELEPSCGNSAARDCGAA